VTLKINGEIRAWRRLTADEYADLFPATPRALRKMARAIRKLGVDGKPFTMNQWELAAAAGVAKRTWQRYEPVFEEWGILEVKRWRYRRFGPTPNTYRTFLGAVIPADWRDRKGPFADDTREIAGKKFPSKLVAYRAFGALPYGYKGKTLRR
jgi:hypothetical protein